MALAGSDLGQVWSYKESYNFTTNEWKVTVFDKAGTGPDEQAFVHADLAEAKKMALAYVAGLLPYPVEWCFAGSIFFVEN